MLPKKPVSRMAAVLELLDTRMPLWFVLLTGSFCMLLSVWFNLYGFIHPELYNYIPFHLCDTTLAHKIYNSSILDNDWYQGRELSYLVDHFDVLMLVKTIQWGLPCFVGASHLVFSVLTGTLIWRFCSQDLGLGRILGLLLALLFWTSTYIFIHHLFRSAKIGAAFCLVWLLIQVYRIFAASSPGKAPVPRPLKLVALFVLALVITLFDRQGLFLLGVLGGLLVLQGLMLRCRTRFVLVGVLGCAALAHLAYFEFLGPALIYALNGYHPDFSFHDMPFVFLGVDFLFFARVGFEILLNTFVLLTGSFSASSGFLLLVLLLLAFAVRDFRRTPAQAVALVGGLGYFSVALLSLAAFWLLFVLMALRHPPLSMPETWWIYYWIPVGSLLVLGMGFALRAALDNWPIPRVAISMGLLLLLAGNILSLPSNLSAVTEGNMKPYVVESRLLRQSLLHLHESSLPVPPMLQQTRLYLVLRDYALEGRRPPAPTQAQAIEPDSLRLRKTGPKQLPSEPAQSGR